MSVVSKARIGGLILALTAIAPVAHADLLGTLTVNGCSSGCGSGPFGTVSVHDLNATTVLVTLTLAPLEVFAVTGSGSALGYDLDKAATLVSGTLTTGFATGGSKTFGGGLGTFAETIVCTGCGNGTSPPNLSGPISFKLTNASGLSSSDFVFNAAGFRFGSDIGVENASGTVVGTGPVGDVPEPGFPLVFASLALGGFALLKRPQARQ